MKKKKDENYEAMLVERFMRWENLYKNGGSDPFWADGGNLNLVRNHIIYTKRQIEETFLPGEYPEIYYKDTPPKVDKNYMARADEIKSNAEESLKIYLQDENYLYLKENINRLTPKEQEDLCIFSVLWYVEGLKRFILSGDLVSMRRHENPERYKKSLMECAKKIRLINGIEERKERIQYRQCSFV